MKYKIHRVAGTHVAGARHNEENAMTKTYYVEVTAKFPPCGERPGIIEVYASSAKDAISKARKEMWRNGHTRHDGPLIYRIRKDEI
jgi:hypothetical protein